MSEMGGVTLSYVCFPLDDYIWWVSSRHGDGNNRKKKLCSLVVCNMRRQIRTESAQQDTGGANRSRRRQSMR